MREAFAVLVEYDALASSRYHCHSARWEDGSGFSLYSRALFDASEDFSGLLNPLGDLADKFCRFTYDFANATGCVIRPGILPRITLVVHTPMIANLPPNLIAREKVIRVSSYHAVRNALEPSYLAWRNELSRLVDELNDIGRAKQSKREQRESR
jgi:hypothetical protein